MEYISSDIRNKNFIVDKIQDIPVLLYTKNFSHQKKIWHFYGANFCDKVTVS